MAIFHRVKYNIKILFGFNLMIGIIIAMGIPFVVSFKFIEYRDMAKISEWLYSLLGIVLLTYIMNIDKKRGIGDVINSKQKRHSDTFLIRLFINSTVLFLLIVIMNIFALSQNAVFPFWKITLGSFVTAIFLGLVGLTISSIVNISTGYMISMAYYVIDLMTGGKYTGDFYLFSLLNDSWGGKYYLIGVSVGLIIANYLIVLRDNMLGSE